MEEKILWIEFQQRSIILLFTFTLYYIYCIATNLIQKLLIVIFVVILNFHDGLILSIYSIF